jgi:peptidoglycan/xylan/chitin deacetylase (PgdA/CDA1 family)
MSLVKKINRNFLLPITHSIFSNHLLPYAKKRIILCYHGVLPNPNYGLNKRHISLSQLKRDLIFLKKKASLFSVSELHNRINNAIPINGLEIAITFDDGFENNYQFAKPLFEELKIPVSFYILSASLTDPNYMNWPECIEYFLSETRNDEILFNDTPYFRKTNWNNDQGVTIFDAIKKLGANRNELISILKNQNKNIDPSNMDIEYWKTMSNKQILECSQSKFITIGSHCHDHYCLGELDATLAKHELSTSKVSIENLIQQEVLELAYPDGSYNRNTINWAEEIGYKTQLAVNYKFEEDQFDKRILDRFSISNSTTHEGNMVRLWLKG